ncbi:class I SAM-dependent methyltransferase [Aquabacter cavernae]|uniref:class I SAM-dependent methyltransferase n=1 Tax=Aquabacter cavernae TaxID=2496029 RepID=UPI000F8DF942|nr:class I SAM-dependent methyltransferase [Aquabacter cavernae]
MARPAGTALDVIREWLGPLEGRSLLDIGCGGGVLTGRLAAEGARMSGVDPAPEAVAAARAALPGARFEAAGGEALPFEDGAFDAAIFVNSFHHVPLDAMGRALHEALRVSRGPVLIIEPLAEGAFFEAMRPVEDETVIRAAALAALAAAMEAGEMHIAASLTYDDVRRFPDVEAFLAKVVSVDPARAPVARAVAPEVAALMARWGTLEDGAIRLNQPHTALLLKRGTAPS